MNLESRIYNIIILKPINRLFPSAETLHMRTVRHDGLNSLKCDWNHLKKKEEKTVKCNMFSTSLSYRLYKILMRPL